MQVVKKRASSEEESSTPKRPQLVEKSAEADVVEKLPLLKRLGRKFRSKTSKHQDSSLKEVLEELIEEHEQATMMMAPEEKTMLKNMLVFGDLTVSDIMTPRTDIMAVPDNVTLEALKKHMSEQRHTRIPVYTETLDNIRGFIHIKDLVPMLGGDEPFDLSKVLRHMLFVAPSMKNIDLLFTMRHSGSHMAIVIDEYGGTDGLVTMEDLVEEIVGDIQDEHDDEEQPEYLQWVSQHVIEADARVRVDKLEEEMDVSILSEEDDEDFDTIGGLIFFHLGRVPARGEIVDHQKSGLRFEILEADSRRIRKVRIVKVKPVATPGL